MSSLQQQQAARGEAARQEAGGKSPGWLMRTQSGEGDQGSKDCEGLWGLCFSPCVAASLDVVSGGACSPGRLRKQL